MNLLWLNGMPRSGTSWLSQIFDSHPDVNFKLSPLFSYPFKNFVGNESTREQWLDLFSQVATSNDEFINQTYRRRSGEYPVFQNKNTSPSFLFIKDTRYHNLTARILEIIPELKFIHIIRNPCGAINSWINTPKEFPKGAEVFNEWRTGACRKTSDNEFWGFDDWKKVSLMYLNFSKKYPGRIEIIQYEDIVENPENVTRKLFEFAGLNMTKQTLDFISHSQQTNIENDYAVFKHKSVKDTWRAKLDKKIIDEITNDIKGTVLARFLI